MNIYDKYKSRGTSPSALFIAGTHQYAFAKEIITSGSVLDVGAGFCTLKEWLPKEVQYMGIDSTEWVADAGSAFHCDVMDYDGNKVDYVCAFGIFESFTDLKPLAIKLKSLSKKTILFTFNEHTGSSFNAHSKKEVLDAFGECEFVDEVKGEVLGRYDL